MITNRNLGTDVWASTTRVAAPQLLPRVVLPREMRAKTRLELILALGCLLMSTLCVLILWYTTKQGTVSFRPPSAFENMGRVWVFSYTWWIDWARFSFVCSRVTS